MPTTLGSKISYYKQLETKPVSSYLLICNITTNKASGTKQQNLNTYPFKFQTQINVITHLIQIRLIPSIIFSNL